MSRFFGAAMLELLAVLVVVGVGTYLLVPPGLEVQIAGVMIPAALILVVACVLVFILGVSLGHRRGKKSGRMFS